MNFCGKLAGILIRNAIEKGNRHNVVVSPLGFNIILNMMAEGLTGRMSGHMCDLLQLKKKGAHHHIPSRLEEMSRTNEKRRMLQNKYVTGPILPEMPENPGSTIRCVTKALSDKTSPLRPCFHRLVTQVYKGEVEEVNFINGDRCAIVDDINSWAKAQSKGLLNNIIGKDDLDASTLLLLVNAIYFRGTWSACFNPELTIDRQFQLFDGQRVSVPFMSGCNIYYHSRVDDFDLIRIPYGIDGFDVITTPYGDASMYMFVPTEIHKFQTMLNKVNSGAFLSHDFELEKSRPCDSLWIPKFNIEYHTKDLLGVLAGIADSSFTKTPLCNSVQQADHENLYAHKISHHSVIKVDEFGTEAASGTCMIRCISGFPIEEEKKEIVVDKPFVFMIRDEKSKLIVFLGIVLDPAQRGQVNQVVVTHPICPRE